jgi:hypothetical protein
MGFNSVFKGLKCLSLKQKAMRTNDKIHAYVKLYIYSNYSSHWDKDISGIRRTRQVV